MITKRDIRKKRVRRRLLSTVEKPRLCVFRSHRHIYAQVIDDVKQHTLVAASTLCKELRENLTKRTTLEAAGEVGRLIGKRAIGRKITKVCFDRGGYLYHGRVKALAEGARSAGLEF